MDLSGRFWREMSSKTIEDQENDESPCGESATAIMAYMRGTGFPPSMENTWHAQPQRFKSLQRSPTVEMLPPASSPRPRPDVCANA
jgi:hypothetical protein